MSQLTKQGKKSITIRQKAVELTRYLPQKQWVGEVKALYDFVKYQIRYVRDIKGVETLHEATRVLLNGAGDCDDKALLLASLLESIGHPTRFIAVGFSRPGFCHVYVETKIGNKWLALETTEDVPFGWKPLNIKRALAINN